MSVFRPEAMARIAQVAEPALTGAAAIWLGRVAWSGLAAGSVAAVLPLIAALVAALWCGVSTLRVAVSLRRPSEVEGGPGVVTVEEGKIGYFGPHGGGFIRLEQLVSVDLIGARVRHGDARIWLFIDEAGVELRIPNAASGAGQLPDALGALPGFNMPQLLTNLLASDRLPLSIWRKPGWRAPASLSQRRV